MHRSFWMVRNAQKLQAASHFTIIKLKNVSNNGSILPLHKWGGKFKKKKKNEMNHPRIQGLPKVIAEGRHNKMNNSL